MSSTPTTVTINGRQHPVKVPPSFAVREELAIAWAAADGNMTTLRRVYAAAVGLCTRALAARPGDKVKLPAYSGDVLAFGAGAYDVLVAQSPDTSLADRVTELFEAGQVVMVDVMESVSPRESEVKERAVFTSPAVAVSTPPVSGSD